MRIDVLSIFPDYLAPLQLSLVGKAVESGLVDLRVHDLRDWTMDRHRTVDDTAYGGGPGMVMSPVVWGEALDAVAASDRTHRPVLVIPTPSGRPFVQEQAQVWSADRWLVFACGRYEGIDSRVARHYEGRADWAGVREVSIGDYVLAGGEAAVLVIVEAVVRLMPGVLGNVVSVHDDSFAPGDMSMLLEGPVFTRPASWRGLDVPDILLSGNHAAIAAWRAQQARERTEWFRPDLVRRLNGGTTQGGVQESR